MRKIIKICITVSVFAIITVLYFIINVDSKIGSTYFFELITALTAILGIFSLVFQSSRSKNLDEAQFIVNLNLEYLKDTDNQKFLDALEVVDELDDSLTKIGAKYFDFFEPLYILIDKQILHISILDELFCYRFFAVVNNPMIQKHVIFPHKEFYKNICKLHKLWKEYRIDSTKIIPLIETDLSLNDWYEDLVYDKRKNNKKKIKKQNSIDSDKIRIRQFELSDIPTIENLYGQLLGNSTVGMEQDLFFQMQVNKNNIILVAEYEKNVIGTVQYVIFDSLAFGGRANVVVDFLIVDEKYRNNGVATLLIEYIKKYANENNIKSIMLVSGANNKVAHGFYKKMKFDDTVKGFRMENK